MPDWYQTMHERLIREDSLGAQKDVTELAQMYEQHPEVRFLVIRLLGDVNCQRIQPDTADIYKPIIPTLIAHLFDSDKNFTRVGALGVLSNLRPSPPFEILEPAIKLSYWETMPTAATGPLRIAAMFCKQSKEAILALRDAAAPDQSAEKRVWAFQDIGQAAQNGCHDQELIDVVLQGLRSDPVDETIEQPNPSVRSFRIDTKLDPQTNKRPPNVVAAAIRAAGKIRLRSSTIEDLERIVAEKNHPLSAATAQFALGELSK